MAANNDDKTMALYEELQIHVPFLNEMISNLRSEMPQHSKIVSLLAMICDTKRKFKFETLKKCEEVILKMKNKTLYKGSLKTPFHATTTVAQADSSQCKTPDSGTPRSPSPEKDLASKSRHRLPVVIPSEPVIPTIGSPDPETWGQSLKNDSIENDRYTRERPSVYSSAAESIKKPNVFQRLGSIIPDITKPPISVADLALLQSDNEEPEPKISAANKIIETIKKPSSKVSLVPAPINKPRSKSDHKISETKKVADTKVDKDKKVDKTKIRPEKIVADPSSIFGSFLSNIDQQIIIDKKKIVRRDSKHNEDDTNKSNIKHKSNSSSSSNKPKKDAHKSNSGNKNDNSVINKGKDKIKSSKSCSSSSDKKVTDPKKVDLSEKLLTGGNVGFYKERIEPVIEVKKVEEVVKRDDIIKKVPLIDEVAKQIDELVVSKALPTLVKADLIADTKIEASIKPKEVLNDAKDYKRIADKYNPKPRKKLDKSDAPVINISVVDEIIMKMKEQALKAEEKIPFLEEEPGSPRHHASHMEVPASSSQNIEASVAEAIAQNRDPRLKAATDRMNFSPPPEPWNMRTQSVPENPFLDNATPFSGGSEAYDPFNVDYDLSALSNVDFYPGPGPSNPSQFEPGYDQRPINPFSPSYNSMPSPLPLPLQSPLLPPAGIYQHPISPFMRQQSPPMQHNFNPNQYNNPGDASSYRGWKEEQVNNRGGGRGMPRGRGDFNRGRGSGPYNSRADFHNNTNRGDFHNNANRGDFHNNANRGDFHNIANRGDFHNNTNRGDFHGNAFTCGDFNQNRGDNRPRSDFQNNHNFNDNNKDFTTNEHEFSNDNEFEEFHDFNVGRGNNNTNRGRGDFHNNSRGDFNNARGDFNNARGDFNNARGDFNNARGDFNNARGDFNNARGDFNNSRGGGFTMRNLVRDDPPLPQNRDPRLSKKDDNYKFERRQSYEPRDRFSSSKREKFHPRDRRRDKSRSRESSRDNSRSRSYNSPDQDTGSRSKKSDDLRKKVIQNFKIPKKPKELEIESLDNNETKQPETVDADASKAIEELEDELKPKVETIENICTTSKDLTPIEENKITTKDEIKDDVSTTTHVEAPAIEPVTSSEPEIANEVTQDVKIEANSADIDGVTKLYEVLKESNVDDKKYIEIFGKFMEFLKHTENKSEDKVESTSAETIPETSTSNAIVEEATTNEVNVEPATINVEPIEEVNKEDESDIENETLVERVVRLKKQRPRKRRSELDKLHEDIKETLGEEVLATSNKRSCTIQHIEPISTKSDSPESIKTKTKALKVVIDKLPPPKLTEVKKNTKNKKVASQANKNKAPPIQDVPIEPIKSKKCLSPIKSIELPIKKMKAIFAEETTDTDDSESTTATASSSSMNASPLPKRRTMSRAAKAISNYAEVIETDTDIPNESEIETTEEEQPAQIETVSKITGGKKKRRNNNWASGVIKKIKKKAAAADKGVNKSIGESDEEEEDDLTSDCSELDLLKSLSEQEIYIEPDKDYYLSMNEINECKLCHFKGKLIVTHYVASHPDADVGIARLSPEESLIALQEAKDTGLVDKHIPSSKIGDPIGKKRRNWKCRWCLAEILQETATYFYEHVSTHTGELRYKCLFCETRNSSQRNLRGHMAYVHKQSVKIEKIIAVDEDGPPVVTGNHVYGYMCSECNFLQLQRSKVDTHIQIFHLEDTACTRVINMTHKFGSDSDSDDAEDAKTPEIEPPPILTKVVARKKPGPKSKTQPPDELVEVAKQIKVEPELEVQKAMPKSRKLQRIKNETQSNEDEAPPLKRVKKTRSQMKLNEEPPILNEAIDEDPNKSKDLDRTIFMCDDDLSSLNDEDHLEEARLEKMKKINASIQPKERTSFLKQLQTRLDAPEATTPTIETTQTLQTSSITREPVVVNQPPMAVSPAKSGQSVVKTNPFSSVIDRLQGRTATTKLPKLNKINNLVEVATDELRHIRVNNVMALFKENTTPKYLCKQPSCIYNTTQMGDFRTHCREVHGNPTTNLQCELCPHNRQRMNLMEICGHLEAHLAEDDDVDQMDVEEVVPLPASPQPSGEEAPPIMVIDSDEMSTENLILPSEAEGPQFSFKITNITSLAPKKIAEVPPLVLLNKTYVTPINIQQLLEPKKVASPPKPANKPVVSTTSGLNYHAPRILNGQISSTSANVFNLHVKHANALAKVPSGLLPAGVPIVATTPVMQSLLLRCRVVAMSDAELGRPRKTANVMYKWLQKPEIMARLFKCPAFSCEFTCEDDGAFEAHLAQAHAFPTAIPCLYCNFKTEQQYIKIHLLMRHAHNTFGCPYCLYRGVSYEYVKIHQHINHTSKDISVVTYEEYPTKIKAPALPPIKSFLDPYTCMCNNQFYTIKYFMNHLTSGACPNDGIVCKTCKRKNTRPYDLIVHATKHDFWEFNCRYCRFGAATTYEISRHIALQHPFHPLAIVCRMLDPAMTSEEYEDYENASFHLLVMTTEGSSASKMVDYVEAVNPAQTLANANNPVVVHATHTKPLSPTIMTRKVALNKNKGPSSFATAPIAAAEAKPLPPQSPIKQGACDADDESIGASDKVALEGRMLYVCPQCKEGCETCAALKTHTAVCFASQLIPPKSYNCVHCERPSKTFQAFSDHLRLHGKARVHCSVCSFSHPHHWITRSHMKSVHKMAGGSLKLGGNLKNQNPDTDDLFMKPKSVSQFELKDLPEDVREISASKSGDRLYFAPQDIQQLPNRPILKTDIICSECNYATKVTSNMARHMHQHNLGLEIVPPANAPVNPVPCLVTNELMFDKMTNLASSSHQSGRMGAHFAQAKPIDASLYPEFIPITKRYVCGANACNYLCLEEAMLKHHLQALHDHESNYICLHCDTELAQKLPLNVEQILEHYRLHEEALYKCSQCEFLGCFKNKVEKHCQDKHALEMNRSIKIRDSSNEVMLEVAPKKKAPWRCALCKFRCFEKEEIIKHGDAKHSIEAQFKCLYCFFKTFQRKALSEHLKKQHVGFSEEFIVCFYHEDEDVINAEAVIPNNPFDTTPLWSKNQVRHIRGIMLEEQVTKKSPKKSPFKKYSNLDLAIDAVAKGVDEVKLCPRKPRLPNFEFVTVTEFDDGNEAPDPGKDLEETPPVLCKQEDALETKETPKKSNDLTRQQIVTMDLDALTRGNFMGTFGPYGRPNDGKYLCPLCAIYETAGIDSFEQHLSEELRYNRFTCLLCAHNCVAYGKMLTHLRTTHAKASPNTSFKTLPIDHEIANWIRKVQCFQLRLMAADKTGAKKSTPVKAKQDEDDKNNSLDASLSCGDEVAPITPEKSNDDGFNYCPHCAYKTKNKWDLKKHMKRHWSIKPYKCGLCKMRAVERSEVAVHFRVHHPNKECKIIELDVGTPTIVPLLRPRGNMTDPNASAEQSEFIYACNHCEERAPSMDDIHNHFMDVHQTHVDDVGADDAAVMQSVEFCFQRLRASNEAEVVAFVCTQCNSAAPTYVNYSEYREHTRSIHHELEPPITPNVDEIVNKRFKCPVCGMTSNSLASISGHIKYHFRPYRCLFCKFTSIYPQPIKDHIAKDHPSEDPTLYELNGKAAFDSRAKLHELLEWDPISEIYLRRKRRMAIKTTARKSTTQFGKRETARKSTSGSSCETGVSHYGNAPDLTPEETQRVQVRLDASPHLPISVAQYGKMINLCPQVLVSDCVLTP